MRLNYLIPKAILWVILVGVFGITACNSSSTAATQTTVFPVAATDIIDAPLSDPPTPALEPAENYASGVSQIPTGMYLFVELSTYDERSEQCQCPAVEPPKWVYKWSSSSELCIEEYFYNLYFPDPTSIVSSTSVLGLFGYGRWQEVLSAINTLPYNEYYIPIYSADSDGVIVIGLQGKEYFLKPGQSWVDSGRFKREPPAGCSISYVNKLTNYGLLNRQRIQPCK
ncbi:MAG: hypothetical protein HZB19_16830 [Chloroflexi bacterium]|nr:hypothetical protein [Chloroflexota bacterium]